MTLEEAYTLLHLKISATKEDITKQFRELALQLHPDKNKSLDATDKFQSLSQAYKIALEYCERNESSAHQPSFFSSPQKNQAPPYFTRVDHSKNPIVGNSWVFDEKGSSKYCITLRNNEWISHCCPTLAFHSLRNVYTISMPIKGNYLFQRYMSTCLISLLPYDINYVANNPEEIHVKLFTNNVNNMNVLPILLDFIFREYNVDDKLAANIRKFFNHESLPYSSSAFQGKISFHH